MIISILDVISLLYCIAITMLIFGTFFYQFVNKFNKLYKKILFVLVSFIVSGVLSFIVYICFCVILIKIINIANFSSKVFIAVLILMIVFSYAIIFILSKWLLNVVNKIKSKPTTREKILIIIQKIFLCIFTIGLILIIIAIINSILKGESIILLVISVIIIIIIIISLERIL